MPDIGARASLMIRIAVVPASTLFAATGTGTGTGGGGLGGSEGGDDGTTTPPTLVAGVTQAVRIVVVERRALAGVTQAVRIVVVPSAFDEPLLNPDGTTALRPEWPVPLTHGDFVLATDGPQRHTRRQAEGQPRRYSLHVRLGAAWDVGVLRRALEKARGGAMPLRWRHPRDDQAGPVASAPRWRIANAEAGQMALARSGAGAVGDFMVELEEVV